MYESLMLSKHHTHTTTHAHIHIGGALAILVSLAPSYFAKNPLGKHAGASPIIGNRGLLSSFRCVRIPQRTSAAAKEK